MKHAVYLLDWTHLGGRMYVGISKHPKQRWRQHKSKNHRLTGSAWAKYGAPKRIILAGGLTLQEAQIAERAYIKAFQTRTPHGYNLTAGGDAMAATTAQRRAWGKAAMTTVQRRKAAKKGWAEKTPDERRAATRAGCVASAARSQSEQRAAALKGHAHRTHEDRSETARKAQAGIGAERRSEIARNRQLDKPKEQRSAEARARSLRRSPELRRESVNKMLESLTPDLRREHMLKRYAGMTAEQRCVGISKAQEVSHSRSQKEFSDAVRKGWETRRRNQRGLTNCPPNT